MHDPVGALPPADRRQRPGVTCADRTAAWALVLIVQPVLGAAIGLQRALAAFGVTEPRDRIGPILGAAGSACVALAVAIVLRRSAAGWARTTARGLFAAAAIVAMSAVVLAVLLYE